MAEISENDLLSKTDADITEAQTNSLHMLQQAIAAMPDIDVAKVEAAIQKIRENKLTILGNPEEQAACAERIARQIIDELGNNE